MGMFDEDRSFEELYIEAVDEAEAFEEAAAEFPEDNGYLLLEAAEAWLRAGHRARAVEVLRPVAAGNSPEAGYALVELADIALFEHDRPEADRLLDEVARTPGMGDGPCEIAALVLRSHGDADGALQWFDRFAGRLTPAQIQEARVSEVGKSSVRSGLQSRRDLRRATRLPPDALDELVEGRVTTTTQRVTSDRFDPRDVERLCRAMAECGAPRVEIVAVDGETIPWPPVRNAPCWCGSTRTYKKCCLAAATQPIRAIVTPREK